MTSIEAVALSKAVSQAVKPVEINPGEYQIDSTFVVRVVGSMKKGENNDYTPTVDIPLKASLALALHYAGCTREKAKEIIILAMTEALNGENVSITDYLADVDAAMQHVEAITAALPKKTRQGALTSKLVMLVGENQEKVDFQPAV